MSKQNALTEPTGTEDLFDWDSIALPQNYQESSGVKKLISRIPVERPNPHEFVRVHPDLSYQAPVFEDKLDKEIYVLMDAQLQEQLFSELVFKIFYVCVNQQGVLKLWPIRLPDADGKLDSYNRTAMEAVNIAKKKWIRIKANKDLGGYDVFVAENQTVPPKWPDIIKEPKAMHRILEIAFRDNRIFDLNHPVIRRNIKGE
jgi:hypothetical protein